MQISHSVVIINVGGQFTEFMQKPNIYLAPPVFSCDCEAIVVMKWCTGEQVLQIERGKKETPHVLENL